MPTSARRAISSRDADESSSVNASGSAVLLAGALAVILVAVWRPSTVRDVAVSNADAPR